MGGSSPVISMAELRHTVPGNARRELQKARKACGKNELGACAGHLLKAIEIDPEYLEARRELGRVYVGLDEPEKVIEAFQAVLRMDPRSADAYSFIGAAQASLEQYGDAELAARQALRIEPNHARGRFVLGMSLAGQRKNDGEALACLAAVSDVFPGAHMIEAHVLARRGETAEARSHLETYREVAPAAQRAEVEDWLARLQKAPRVVSAGH
jgi:tetratricopeptide (TPR) repeat protein